MINILYIKNDKYINSNDALLSPRRRKEDHGGLYSIVVVASWCRVLLFLTFVFLYIFFKLFGKHVLSLLLMIL